MRNNTKHKDNLVPYFISDLKENAPFVSEAGELLRQIDSETLTPNVREKAMTLLSTIRNRELITVYEQNKLRETTVAFFGLSVGSHAALTWMMESRAKSIKISDPDFISPTNLNRLRFGWDTVGQPKTQVVEKQLKDIHPYCTVETCTGTDLISIDRLLTEGAPTQFVVDAMDDIPSKLHIRQLAKALKIPVIMATDVGDNVLLDIERYDLIPQPGFFLGRADGIEQLDVYNLTPQQRRQLAIKIVGLEHNSQRMTQSLKSIGKSIKTWPQLGATATIAGGTVATAIKKIVLGEAIPNGRYVISLDSIFSSQ